MPATAHNTALKSVTVYTDGGCEGNPGPGGWAAVLLWNGRSKELSGGEPATTNNRMELKAALEGLRALKEPCEVLIYTDSQYLRQGITGWIKRWKVTGWRSVRTKAPIKNIDLWQALDAAVAGHRVEWRWVKGHAGHQHYEQCDQLARHAVLQVKKRYSPPQLKALLAEFNRSTQPEMDAVALL